MLVMELLNDIPGFGVAGDLVIAERELPVSFGQYVVIAVPGGYEVIPWNGQAEYEAVVRSVIS